MVVTSVAGPANINGLVMKGSNLRLLLERVRAEQSISRRDLAVATGLTAATVTNLTRELLAEGYLVESGRAPSRSGPRPILLEINPDWGAIVGVELTVTDIVCVVTDFQARILSRQQCEYQMAEGRDTVLLKLGDVIEQAIAAARLGGTPVRGIGVVSAGPFDSERGEMLAPPNFPGWGRTPITQILTDRFGIPVWFDKETQAAALGEYWFGEAGGSQVLFACNVFRVGIGGGVLLAGKPFRGHRENAGNIGHTKVSLTGPKCACGEYGCLEAVADGRAAVRQVRSQYADDPTGFGDLGITAADQINFDVVVRGAAAGVEPCVAAVQQCARHVGMALANVVRIIAPDTIVLCGEFPDSSELFVQECFDALAQRHAQTQDDLRVLHSGLGAQVAALGGVAIVLDNVGLSPQHS